ncbi:transforming growth factor beta like domain-containing protein [Ditylenchus destructor]|uniref:Transforming growth factor beta like domain-containing protein n=1 Tax=Ditylenchus destructor TaxID=166010 RepID=A0AAD4NDY7_9BILA|nr:transforming growth factor beta like domain-containing protein [Ditylenchus destructor]
MCLIGSSTNRFVSFILVYYLVLITCDNSQCTIFYTDEEEQQTRALPISITGRKMDRFQTQVLDLLGLEKPSGDKAVAMTDKLASHYMSHLYRKINREDADQFNPNFDFLNSQLDSEPNFDFENIQEDSHNSDTIASFAPTKVSKSDSSTNEVHFNLSNSFEDLRLVNANLYLILDQTNISSNDVVIEAFSETNTSRVNFEGFHWPNGSSIITLNITRIFFSWLENLRNSQQLIVKFRKPIRRLKRSLSSHMVVEENWDETESQETVHEEEPIFSAKSQQRSSSAKHDLLNRVRPLTGRRCKVRSLYVDFKDLGWDAWVIAPTGYQADYCDGDCSFPLDSSLTPTNHAIVQTLVHVLDERRASPAQCAPTALKSQSILFFNNERNVVMRRYHNMRVRQCGCK